MYNLESYRPIELGGLIRLGRDYYGGYAASKRQFEKTDILPSFGVNDGRSFESDFEKLKAPNMKHFHIPHRVLKKLTERQ
jgi:hypothetical protein